MADINVFNTFSFQKWSERLRERKMEEEIQRQRMDQVIRLRDKLAREREIREMADILADDDVEKLIELLNRAGAFKQQPQATMFGIPAAATLEGQFGVANLPNYIAGNNVDKAKQRKKAEDDKKKFSYNRRWADVAKRARRNGVAAKQPSHYEIYDFEYNRRYGDLI